MLPIVNVVARFLGVRGNSRYQSESNDSDTNGTKKVSHSRTSNSKDVKTSNSNFYRLPDENHSGATPNQATTMPVAGDLRKDDLAYERSVKCLPRSSKDDSSGDEIPLQGIRVKTEFMRSAAKN